MKENFKKESPLLGLEGSGGGLSFFGGTASDPTYVDDVFSTFVYEGSQPNAQTINNGLDLSGEGGLVWLKQRSSPNTSHFLFDTERGTSSTIGPDSTGSAYTSSRVSSFNSNGFSLTNDGYSNGNGYNYVSWSFRKAPGFFDVVTYTGNGTSGRAISHGLGSTPGMIIIKCTNATTDWPVWHRSAPNVGSNYFLRLNTTDPSGNPYQAFLGTPNASNFYVGANDAANGNGNSYVAYVFAHDDQSFGTDQDEAIIKCGSYTGSGSSYNEINVGFEPQFLIFKNASSSGAPWYIMDMVRGLTADSAEDQYIFANTSGSENDASFMYPTSTGFGFTATGSGANASGNTYIYMAIRRPHKPPEAATEVFDVGLRSGSSSDAKTNSDIFTDMTFVLRKDSSGEYNGIASRISGRYSLKTTNTDQEGSGWMDSSSPWAHMTGAMISGGNGAANTGNLIDFSFKRAPGFFDVVGYRGDGSDTQTESHNLGAVPELMIVKSRNYYPLRDWAVYSSVTGISKFIYLQRNDAPLNTSIWRSTTPTSTQFTVGASTTVNASGYNYIAYLFATLDGISKVGSYTGTGSNVNVNCGFSAGARFVLIRRTDSSGDWYVFNTASGIASGNDPYMLLNSTAAEVNGTDYIDPLNAGFTVTSSAPAALNASGGTYLFLAVA